MSEHIFETGETDDGLAVYVIPNVGITGSEPHEEIIRCRECKRSRENGWKCTYWVSGRWDEKQKADVMKLADVEPDGFCFKAEKRQA